MTTRTAAQRRQEAKIAYDAFLACCPSRQVLDAISDKWVCLVLSALATGPRRYGQLQDEIAGVSPKMLTQTLRSLERDGLVDRTVTAQVPVRVDYSLTELGRDLQAVIYGIKRWAERNVEQIYQARAVYDARPEQPAAR
ncbi:helix-turn-helix transcriptional regulator [Frankia sp. CNm7]|uniref:Helix-turn-helix transcriptional regulator n=1 Tax=Frankia nepalensis TaxID=1836974 RepID=A0A937R9J0_9ACTN|nr:helix-turn-helix transcriptional regulator [Frankia nepalensis]MBL7514118.1 helix-turn-helix transcriptional regulator [Frankia nepalensis]MBL7519233.1 helix-turn-helix transcriptional regulator [Frankia nepalensis]MBL7626375.1 helix-turn-helix transcriptional regulator [Frankia nepalensis]